MRIPLFLRPVLTPGIFVIKKSAKLRIKFIFFGLLLAIEHCYTTPVFK